jgi:hypothetical protein
MKGLESVRRRSGKYMRVNYYFDVFASLHYHDISRSKEIEISCQRGPSRLEGELVGFLSSRDGYSNNFNSSNTYTCPFRAVIFLTYDQDIEFQSRKPPSEGIQKNSKLVLSTCCVGSA